MRPTTLVAATLLLAAIPAAAQEPPAVRTPPAFPPPGSISRIQYVARAMQRAGRTFDRIDVNHTGTITFDQLRAWREAHRPAR